MIPEPLRPCACHVPRNSRFRSIRAAPRSTRRPRSSRAPLPDSPVNGPACAPLMVARRSSGVPLTATRACTAPYVGFSTAFSFTPLRASVPDSGPPSPSPFRVRTFCASMVAFTFRGFCPNAPASAARPARPSAHCPSSRWSDPASEVTALKLRSFVWVATFPSSLRKVYSTFASRNPTPATSPAPCAYALTRTVLQPPAVTRNFRPPLPVVPSAPASPATVGVASAVTRQFCAFRSTPPDAVTGPFQPRPASCRRMSSPRCVAVPAMPVTVTKSASGTRRLASVTVRSPRMGPLPSTYRPPIRPPVTPGQ